VILVAPLLLDVKVIDEVAFGLVFFFEHSLQSVPTIIKGKDRCLGGILDSIEDLL
jgi:hypothetical protein